MKIKIKTSNIQLEAELYDNNTAKEIAKILPIKAEVDTWGEEIYFKIPIHTELDNTAKEVVEKGDLGFWPSGDCFCIFFGPTPNSQRDEIRLASKVNVFGKVKGNLEVLKTVKNSEIITVEKA